MLGSKGQVTEIDHLYGILPKCQTVQKACNYDLCKVCVC